MAFEHKFSSLLLILAIFALVGCNPTTTTVPTADQDAVGTIVAATRTERAKETPPATPTLRPTQPQPTLPEPTPVPATLTPRPSPTSGAPSALRIAYIKAGDIHIWTEGYGSVRLTDTHDAIDVQVSGDGALVAYLRQDPQDAFSHELWVVNTSAPPEPRQLVSSQDLAALMPAEPNPFIGGIGILDFDWRYGTHALAYSTLVLHEGPGFSPNHDLRLVDADSLQKTTLFAKGEGGIFYLSPDGNQVALSNPESISLVNIDGSNLRRDVLTFPAVITYSEYQYHPRPVWAADSSSLRVTIPPADPLAEPLPATGLWSIPVDGSPAVLLGNIYAIPFAWPNNAFAPNFEKVAYVMQVGIPTDNQRELHIADPDGSNDGVYDRGESMEFKSWSPDSRYFIYENNGGEREGLYVGAPGGQPVRILPDPYQVVSVQWIDNRRIAYFLANGEFWELRITNLEGDSLAFIDTVPATSSAFDIFP